MVCLGCFIPFYKIILLSSRRGRLRFFFFILYFLFFETPGRLVGWSREQQISLLHTHLTFKWRTNIVRANGRAATTNKQTCGGKWGNCGVGLRRWKCEGVLWKFCIGFGFFRSPYFFWAAGSPSFYSNFVLVRGCAYKLCE